MIQNPHFHLNKAIVAALLILLGISSGCSKDAPTSPNCPVCANPLVDSSAVVLVTKVLDGDTFRFMIKNDEFDVRILDIDCFETRHGSRLDTQAVKAGITVDSALALGFAAKALADSLLTGKQVTLTRDSIQPDFDVFGRVLRRVYLSGNINYGDYMKARRFTVPK